MIGLDGNEANISQRVGSNTYAFQILKGLHRLDPKTDYQVYLKAPRLADLPAANSHWRYRLLTPSPLWTQWRLPLDLYLTNPKPELFFTPGHYAPRYSPIPSVISILDLAFLHYPDSFKPRILQQLKSWTKHSALHAAHIFTISQSSKRDIIDQYHITPNKITVTYPGSNLKSAKVSKNHTAKVLKQYKLTEPYFIFVGTRQPRKNLPRLIQAFIDLKKSYQKPLKLVIVGKTWHQFANQSDADHPDIIYTGYVPDQDLPILISQSLALVFPSLYEGFGIPVLEAMRLGTLVAASNISSIPEITGDSPLLFGPTKTKQITGRLQTILTMSLAKKQKLIKTAKIRAKQFTWDNCAHQTIQVLHQLAQPK